MSLKHKGRPTHEKWHPLRQKQYETQDQKAYIYPLLLKG